MIDIATATPPHPDTYSALAVPFDWILLPDPAAAALPWHDASNLCAGVSDYNDDVEGTYAFALEAGLHTAVTLSLYSDARAGRDDALPYNSNDKRGWVGEAFVPNGGAKLGAWGSRLWLNFYTVAHDDVPEAQRFAAQESLAWLISVGMVDAVEVTASYVHKDSFELLALHIIMRRDGQSEPIYDAVWGATLDNAEGTYGSA